AVRIFDVRVYPVVEAPDAIEHLAGMTLLDACRQCLFEDPEATAARGRAIAAGGMTVTLGNPWPPYSAVWPVRHGPSAINSPVGFLREGTEADIKTDQAKDGLGG